MIVDGQDAMVVVTAPREVEEGSGPCAVSPYQNQGGGTVSIVTFLLHN